jgi:hypothetical protein
MNTMILASSASHGTHTLGLAYGVIAFALLTFWSAWSVRRGKPAIPNHIRILIPLAVYILHLQWSLPYIRTPPDTDRSPEQQSRAESNDHLRRDLDRAIKDLDQLTDVTYALLNLAWLAGIVVIANWLGPRMDDRNWIHGGIRPSPNAAINAESNSVERTGR